MCSEIGIKSFKPQTEDCLSRIGCIASTEKLTRVNIYYHHKICKVSVRVVQKGVLGFIGNRP